MRKQTKLAVVLAAAALLAVGSASLVSAGWVQEGAEWRYVDNSGDYVTDEIKKSGDISFYLDENGYMAKDYFLTGYGNNDDKYYFAANGAMVKNTWVAIDPEVADIDDEDLEVCWFYFQETGKAVKAASSKTKKKAIDGKTYFFDDEGVMLTGWFDGNGERMHPDDDDDFKDCTYYAGEDGVARAGWLAYTEGVTNDDYIGADLLSDKTTLYFYFDTSNFTKKSSTEKNLNGKKYQFDDRGIMYSGWQYIEDQFVSSHTSAPSDDSAKDVNGDLQTVNAGGKKINYKYYSGEDDGHMVRKGWVYAVPSAVLDGKAHDDDEEKYFYFNSDGTMAYGMEKKINGKNYIFDKVGIMKTGLVIIDKGGNFLDVIKLDDTNGSDWIKKNQYVSDVDSTKLPTLLYDYNGATGNRIHYYGSDGARINSSKVSVEFNDDTYYFSANNNGDGRMTKDSNKKYYSNGFLLKASSDIKYGIVLASDNGARRDSSADGGAGDGVITYTSDIINHGTSIIPNNDEWDYINNGYGNQNLSTATSSIIESKLWENLYVVTTSGSLKKKEVKDGNGNYWLIDNNGRLLGIYNCEVEFTSNGSDILNNCRWKSEANDGVWIYGKGNPSKSGWYEGYYNSVTNSHNDNIEDHRIEINDDYCLNFYLQ